MPLPRLPTRSWPPRQGPVASLTDAIDQVTGKRGFMSHDMAAASGHFAGRAVTALLRPAPPEKATAQLTARDSVQMIDEAKPGEVGVIVIEDGLDVAALGGLIGTEQGPRPGRHGAGRRGADVWSCGK